MFHVKVVNSNKYLSYFGMNSHFLVTRWDLNLHTELFIHEMKKFRAEFININKTNISCQCTQFLYNRLFLKKGTRVTNTFHFFYSPPSTTSYKMAANPKENMYFGRN